MKYLVRPGPTKELRRGFSIIYVKSNSSGLVSDLNLLSKSAVMSLNVFMCVLLNKATVTVCPIMNDNSVSSHKTACTFFTQNLELSMAIPTLTLRVSFQLYPF